MKPNEILLNTTDNEIDLIDLMGDEHISTSADTPLRDDAFALSDTEKIDRIEKHFREIMLTLGLDLNDDSLNGTPVSERRIPPVALRFLIENQF
jgi:GTP cyclohydrolase I